MLRILRGQYPDPLTTSGILDRMLEKNAGVSRIVDRLQKKGLVQKTTCQSDKRLVDVIITERALRILEQMDNNRHRIDEIYARLSEKEIKTLNDLLDKLRG